MSLIHWWPLIKFRYDFSDKIGNDSFKLINYNAKFSEHNILGSGFSFGPSSDSRLEIPIAAAKDLKGSFSISFWMKINSWNTSWETPLGLYKDDTSWAGNIVSFLRNGSTSTIAFCISNGINSTQNNCVSGTLSTGVWYRVTGVYSPGSIKLYIDSTLQKEYMTTIVPNTNAVTFANIGAATSNSYQTNSSIQDVRFYDQALSLKEIAELSKGEIFHYSFNYPLVEGTTNYNIVNETGINNLSSMQNISLTSDSAIGSSALICNGSTYISGNSVGDTTKGGTVSLWVKTPTYPTTNSVVFADPNSKLAFGFYGTTDAIISCGSIYSSSIIHSGVASNIKNSWKSGWNHICITRNASDTISCWLNGTKYTLSETTSYWDADSKCVIGGKYRSGRYPDRIQ